MTVNIDVIAVESENFVIEVYDGVTYNGGEPTGAPLYTLTLGANTVPFAYDSVLLVSPIGGSEIPSVTNVPSGQVFDPYYFQKISGTEKWYLNFSPLGTYLEVTVTAIGGATTVAPSNKIHLVTPEDIKELYTKNLFTIIGSGENAVEVSAVDYIIQLMKFPFEVPEDSIGDNLNIILGDYDTDINTPLANTDIIPIDFGTIAVPAPKSSLDYESVNYFLQVPQVEGEIELDMVNIPGGNILVIGLFDVYNGDLTINVYNSETGRRNLLTDTGSLANWVTNTGATIIGEQEFSISNNTTAAIHNGSVTVVPETQYTYSFDVMLGTIQGFRYAVRDMTHEEWIGVNIEPSELLNDVEYTRIFVTFTTPENCASIRLYAVRTGNSNSGTAFSTNFQLELGDTPTPYQHIGDVYNSEAEPFLSVKRGLGREIPIINRKEKVIGSLGAQIGNDNELLKARIVKKYPEIVVGEQNNLIELSGNLNGLTGYVEVDSIKLDFNTIGNEKDAILNELRQGVYIK